MNETAKEISPVAAIDIDCLNAVAEYDILSNIVHSLENLGEKYFYSIQSIDGKNVITIYTYFKKGK